MYIGETDRNRTLAWMLCIRSAVGLDYATTVLLNPAKTYLTLS
jgi:hypothetical protein